MSTADDVASISHRLIDQDTDTGVGHASSPLGAWVLRETIRSSAADADRATRSAVDMIRQGDHPGVALRSATWAADHIADPGLRILSMQTRDHRPTFRPEVAALDVWTSAATGGIWGQFPVDFEPDPMATLVHPHAALAGPSVVAAVSTSTNATWQVPLIPTADSALCAAWGVSSVLRQRDSCGLALDPVVGVVGVTQTVARDGLACVSVIADHDVPRERVVAAAHRISRRLTGGDRLFLTVPPAVSASWWSVDDTTDTDPFGSPVNTALLPASGSWSHHDLYHSGEHYYDVFSTHLRERLRADHLDFRSRQSAAVWFTATGVTGTAVTAVRVDTLFPSVLTAQLEVDDPPVEVPAERDEPRSLTLRYDHPFATVVSSVSEHPHSPWSSLPVWSTWVTGATET